MTALFAGVPSFTQGTSEGLSASEPKKSLKESLRGRRLEFVTRAAALLVSAT